MKKLKEHLDPRMTKICVYAGATVIAVCVLLFLLYYFIMHHIMKKRLNLE